MPGMGLYEDFFLWASKFPEGSWLNTRALTRKAGFQFMHVTSKVLTLHTTQVDPFFFTNSTELLLHPAISNLSTEWSNHLSSNDRTRLYPHNWEAGENVMGKGPTICKHLLLP